MGVQSHNMGTIYNIRALSGPRMGLTGRSHEKRYEFTSNNLIFLHIEIKL